MTSIRSFLIAMCAALIALGAVSCEKNGVQAAREGIGPADTPNNKSSSNAETKSTRPLSMDDKDFLVNAEKTVVRERALAQSAYQRSHNALLTEYTRHIIDDRNKALTELIRLMNDKGVSQPFSLSDIQLSAANHFSRMSSPAVEHEYFSLMAAEQQDVLADFQRAAETAEDPDVRKYASRMLPNLRKDFDTAVDLQNKLAQPGAATR